MKKMALAAAILGVFAGLGGASHGPGEMLQGNLAPESLIIEAWPTLVDLQGEPAMTIIPSYLVSGILTIVVGVMVAVWAGKFIEHRYGGLVLIGLSVLLLLVGGGLIPPFISIAAGILAMISNYKSAKNGGGN